MATLGAGRYSVNTPNPPAGDQGEVPLRVNQDGSLQTSGGGSATADGSTFTPGTTSGTIAEGVYESTPTTVTDNKAAAIGIDNKRNVKVTLGTALAKTIDSVTVRPEAATYTNITASTLIRTGAGILVGMYVNSTSTGTIKFWDNTSAATTVINNTITPAIGWHNLGNAAFTTGLYATIASTLDVTIYWIPTP